MASAPTVESAAATRAAEPTEPAEPAEPKARTPLRAGQDIRPLLWMLGVEIESGGPIANVEPRNRFTLRRVPSLSSIRPSSEQMQMASMLANGYVTPDELAAATKSSLSSAVRLIAFFSFFGLVSELPDVAA